MRRRHFRITCRLRRRVAVPIQRLRLMRHPLHFSFNDLPNFNCTKYNFIIYYLASASVRHNLTAIKIVRDDEVKICLLKCIIMNNKDISLTSEQNCILWAGTIYFSLSYLPNIHVERNNPKEACTPENSTNPLKGVRNLLICTWPTWWALAKPNINFENPFI